MDRFGRSLCLVKAAHFISPSPDQTIGERKYSMLKSDSILIVEDDEVDRLSILRAFKDLNIANPKVEASDGKEALAYLLDPNKIRPCLILLDINMPRMNGIEFLQIIKADPILKMIPVVMLTTSAEDKDKIESYQLGVAGYMVKPVEYLGFVEIMKIIHLYWIASLTPPMN